MPLDGHSYLVSQGWTGKGTGLRQGAISRPLAIPQKKTLAGLGKDRDEAFPFWDHLFSAAAKSIQVKIDSDDEGSGTEPSVPTLKRTTTGILSNRRPTTGTPATTSGTDTPDSDQLPRLSLLSMAKREAAKRGLYARFFRGPILGPHGSDDDTSDVGEGPSTPVASIENPHNALGTEIKSKKRCRSEGGDMEQLRKKQRKESREKKEMKKGLKEAANEADTTMDAERERKERKERRERKRVKKDRSGVSGEERDKKKKKKKREEEKKVKEMKKVTATVNEESCQQDLHATAHGEGIHTLDQREGKENPVSKEDGKTSLVSKEPGPQDDFAVDPENGARIPQLAAKRKKQKHLDGDTADGKDTRKKRKNNDFVASRS